MKEPLILLGLQFLPALPMIYFAATIKKRSINKTILFVLLMMFLSWGLGSAYFWYLIKNNACIPCTL